MRSPKKVDEEAKRKAESTENRKKVIAMHEDFIARIPSLPYSEEVRASMLRGGNAWLDDFRRARETT
ncbi:MAG: hypothetical protein ABL984_00460 [Pyrinomonadaceae bacterium]